MIYFSADCRSIESYFFCYICWCKRDVTLKQSLSYDGQELTLFIRAQIEYWRSHIESEPLPEPIMGIAQMEHKKVILLLHYLGLLEKLEVYNLTQENITKAFALSAMQLLIERVQEDGPKYVLLNHLNGWIKRLNTYYDKTLL